ncbi:hypothetical protein BRC77_07670 [Halobacteriales archaeon QH_8_64_26]|nr:MAG: hypothetical protein BRC77_07670 [Halobacteriales archaeon QH_8_64_26]
MEVAVSLGRIYVIKDFACLLAVETTRSADSSAVGRSQRGNSWREALREVAVPGEMPENRHTRHTVAAMALETADSRGVPDTGVARFSSSGDSGERYPESERDGTFRTG